MRTRLTHSYECHFRGSVANGFPVMHAMGKCKGPFTYIHYQGISNECLFFENYYRLLTLTFT